MARRSLRLRNSRSIVKEYLGEESTSDSDNDSEHEQTFNSPSTDVGATRYSLDFTSANPNKKDNRSIKKPQINRPEVQETPLFRPQQEENAETDNEESEVDVEFFEPTSGTRPLQVISPKTQNTATGSQSNRTPVKKSSKVFKKKKSKYQQSKDYTSDEGNIRKKSRKISAPRRISPRKSNDSTAQKPSHVPIIKAKPNVNLPKVYKEIRSIQDSTSLQIKKLPFSRVIRELLMKHDPNGFYITPQALAALQESAELYLTILFQDAYRCTMHRDRVTLHPKDLQLVRFLRGPQDPGNL